MIVGLTGGIAVGKSTCVRYFRQEGVVCVDADAIAKDLLVPNAPLLMQIAQRFGSALLLENGALNRALLRDLIAKDEESLKALNKIMLPAIQKEALLRLKALEAMYDLVIYDAPLLLENDFARYCDMVVLVDAPLFLQKARAQQRDLVPLTQVEAFIERQMPRDEKIKRCNFVIDNSGDLQALYAQCRRLLQILYTFLNLNGTLGNE